MQLKPRAVARGPRPHVRRAASDGRPRRPPPRCTTSSSSTWRTRSARSASARATTRASSSSSPTAARCRCSRRRSPSASGSTRSSSRRTAPCSARSGCSSSDYVMRIDQGVGWDLSKPEGVGRVNEIAEQMVADGDRPDGCSRGLPPRPDRGPAQRRPALPRPGVRAHAPDAGAHAHRGRRVRALRRVPRALRAHLRRGHRVEGRAGLADQLQRHRHRAPAGPARVPRGDRRTASRTTSSASAATCSCPRSGSTRRSRSYDDASFTVGTKVEGPAIVDAVDTTIYVPPRDHGGARPVPQLRPDPLEERP